MPEIGDVARPDPRLVPPALARLQEDALIVVDATGRIVAVNAAACALTGYRQSELIGMDGLALVAPEWGDFTVRQRRRKMEAIEEVSRYECVFLHKDGTRIPVELTSTIVRQGTEVTGVEARLKDLRKPVAAERRLESTEDRFRAAFEGAAIGMGMVSSGGRWLKVNHALTRFLGYSEAELLDLGFRDVTHPDDLAADVDSMHDVLAGRLSWYQTEVRYVRKDGAIVWGLLAVCLVRDRAGNPAYFIRQISDITAARTAAAERLGVLAGLPSPAPRLSKREREVVGLLAEGQQTIDAARTLGISEETIQTLVKRAMRKLAARNRTHLVAKAIRLGLLSAAT